ncbi:MAG: hypothetical protein ACYC26_16095 [Phycisphaerales bacterium]
MESRTDKLIGQIDRLLAKLPPIKQSWHSSNSGGIFQDTVAYEAFTTECHQLLAHVYPSDHLSVQRTIHAFDSASLHSLKQVEGILIGTRENLAAGLIDDLTSAILLDIKADFLEMAHRLVEGGQKDPAAVLASIVLEDSLKRLAKKHGIGGLEDKEISVVAGSLFSNGIIEKTTNQSIQSFKSLRNAALHAQWSEVSLESLNLLLVFLPTFMEKHGI